MANRQLILGIDTSNYTTSLSLLNVEKQLVKEARRLLPVKAGEVGLRQSEALFQHISNLPELFEELLQGINPSEIAAIASATRPRPLEESYMPVFLAAKSYGQALSSALKVPFYEFSHQEGHIEAGLWSIGLAPKKPFMALHLSGGTTEALEVIPHGPGYQITILGGTSDLSAGQYIDRIGVKLGLPFPAGPHLEALAKGWTGSPLTVPISVKENQISLSGPETYLQRLLEKDHEPSAVARGVFDSLGKALSKLIKNLSKPYQEILLVGGVACNSFIKNQLMHEFKTSSMLIHFANPRFSSDNAVGIGLLGVKNHANKNTFGYRGNSIH